MMTQSEKEALLNYLEFLLVKDFIEPILDKHIHDADVLACCYDKAYEIVNELDREIAPSSQLPPQLPPVDTKKNI